MRISDWSSDVCSSDLIEHAAVRREAGTVQQARDDTAARLVPPVPVLVLGKAGELNGVHGQALLGSPPDGSSYRGSSPCGRSAERRVGKECVSPCPSRCAPYH